MLLPKKEIQKFQKGILDWYEKNQRPLPWRKTRDPYKILVSEVMSQQTQINRVVPKYLAWIERFPTLQSLAEAPTSEVLRYWNGLGYNRRALYLQRLAKELTQRHSGKQSASRIKEGSWTSQDDSLFPSTEEALKKLPGIGEYTARAILCFAFEKQIAVVDTNVRKVILTKFSMINDQYPTSNKEIQIIAEQLLPKGKAYEWNQALMDYSGVMLKEHKIPIPKQSHFKTSNRFYRGQVVRMLLKSPETLDSAFEKLENNGITKEKFEEIVMQMEKDGLVIKKKNKIFLPN